MLLQLGVSIDHAAALNRCASAHAALSESPEKAALKFWCIFHMEFLLLKDHLEDLNDSSIEEIAICNVVSRSLAALLNAWRSNRQNEILGQYGLTSYEKGLAEGWLHLWKFLGRSFCVTEQNRPCNCMNEVRVGDVVAALEGADVLYILRPVGNRYRLIGDAYVDGLMLGEAYEGVNPEDVDYDIQLV